MNGLKSQKKQRNKRNFKPLIIGTSTDNYKLKATEKKKWLFIGKVHKANNLDDLKEHIKNLLNNNDFECARMNTKYDTNCFKLGVKEEDYEKIIDSKNWPQNIKISRFIFQNKNSSVNQNFQENPNSKLNP